MEAKAAIRIISNPSVATISLTGDFSCMEFRPTPLERAFELARSGEFPGLGAMIDQLRAEGFSVSQVEGPTLKRQLRELCVASYALRDQE